MKATQRGIHRVRHVFQYRRSKSGLSTKKSSVSNPIVVGANMSQVLTTLILRCTIPWECRPVPSPILDNLCLPTVSQLSCYVFQLHLPSDDHATRAFSPQWETDILGWPRRIRFLPQQPTHPSLSAHARASEARHVPASGHRLRVSLAAQYPRRVMEICLGSATARKVCAPPPTITLDDTHAR